MPAIKKIHKIQKNLGYKKNTKRNIHNFNRFPGTDIILVFTV